MYTHVEQWPVSQLKLIPRCVSISVLSCTSGGVCVWFPDSEINAERHEQVPVLPLVWLCMVFMLYICFLCFFSLPVQWLVTFFITSLLWEESILPQPSVDHRGIIGSQKNHRVGKDLPQPPVSPMKPCSEVPHPRSHKPNPIKSDSNVPAGEYIFSLLLQL